jgi:threonine/homoserine/homoserine lactone efflux protein
LGAKAGTGGGKTVQAGGFMRGFFTGISNPKDILFFVSFFPQFIAISRDFTTSITTLCLLWIVFDFAVMAGYIVAIKRFLPVTQSRRFAACGALFIAIGRLWDCLEPDGREIALYVMK